MCVCVLLEVGPEVEGVGNGSGPGTNRRQRWSTLATHFGKSGGVSGRLFEL